MHRAATHLFSDKILDLRFEETQALVKLVRYFEEPIVDRSDFNIDRQRIRGLLGSSMARHAHKAKHCYFGVSAGAGGVADGSLVAAAGGAGSVAGGTSAGAVGVSVEPLPGVPGCVPGGIGGKPGKPGIPVSSVDGSMGRSEAPMPPVELDDRAEISVSKSGPCSLYQNAAKAQTVIQSRTKTAVILVKISPAFTPKAL
jgi:hypothetical protein